jgi:hypothetical protein
MTSSAITIGVPIGTPVKPVGFFPASPCGIVVLAFSASADGPRLPEGFGEGAGLALGWGFLIVIILLTPL